VAATIAEGSLPADADGLALITCGLALAALLLLLASLVLAWTSGIGLVLAALGLLYLSHLYISGESAGVEAALVGVGLLLVGELSQWSLHSRLSGRYERSLHASRAIGLMVLISLALGMALLAQLVSGVRFAGNLGSVAAGTAAAVGFLVLIASVAGRGISNR
jgi:hypothetical protein